MAVLFIAALFGGYILYVLWYSIVHEYLDAVILILGMCTLIALTVWCESGVAF